MHDQEGRRLDLLEFPARVQSGLETAQQPLREVLARRRLERVDHLLRDGVVADDVADSAAPGTGRRRMRRYDVLAVEERGAAGAVDDRELPPVDGVAAGTQRFNRRGRGLAGLQQIEALRPERRIGAMLRQHGADTRAGIRASRSDADARRGDGGAEHAGPRAFANQ